MRVHELILNDSILTRCIVCVLLGWSKSPTVLPVWFKMNCMLHRVDKWRSIHMPPKGSQTVLQQSPYCPSTFSLCLRGGRDLPPLSLLFFWDSVILCFPFQKVVHWCLIKCLQNWKLHDSYKCMAPLNANYLCTSRNACIRQLQIKEMSKM